MQGQIAITCEPDYKTATAAAAQTQEESSIRLTLLVLTLVQVRYHLQECARPCGMDYHYMKSSARWRRLEQHCRDPAVPAWHSLAEVLLHGMMRQGRPE